MKKYLMDFSYLSTKIQQQQQELMQTHNYHEVSIATPIIICAESKQKAWAMLKNMITIQEVED